MNPTPLGFFERIRQNFLLLTFLTIAILIIILYLLLMGLALLGGSPMFSDPNDLGMDIFMVFIFPIIASVFISITSLVITGIFRQGTTPGCLITILLGVLPPLAAVLLTSISSLITKKLYISTPQGDAQAWKFLKMNVGETKFEKTQIKPIQPTEQPVDLDAPVRSEAQEALPYLRIDRATTLPGLVKNGQSFTLILKQNWLYLLYTGIPSPFLINVIQKKEASIELVNLDELVKEKRNDLLPLTEITDVKMTVDVFGPYLLKFKGRGKKYSFAIDHKINQKEVVEKFVALLKG